MIAQSYCHNPMGALPPAPDHLILNTAGLVKQLRNAIRELDDTEENEIVSSVLEALTYRNNAPLELEYSVNTIIAQRMGIENIEYFRPMIDAIEAFGQALFAELQRLNAYRNGYLFYQYMRMLNADIVLVRLVPPDLNPGRTMRRY